MSNAKNNVNVMLVFDMDGTIADLYNVSQWLEHLKNESVYPYEMAKPRYDMERLATVLEKLRDIGWRIAVTSWTASGGSTAYEKATRVAKLKWLNDYGFPYDEVHILKYGSTKANATRNKAGFQILFDDNEKVCKGWNLGRAINASKVNLVEFLEDMID